MHKRDVAYLIVNISLALMIVAAIIIFGAKYIHPQKYLEQSRDVQRLTDVTNLATSLDLYIADGQSLAMIKPNQVYSSRSGSADIHGHGWLPLNFASVSSGVPITSLAFDPLNNQNFYYRVGINPQNQTYEIDCRFESPANNKKAQNDGGNNPDWYEVGTDLTILK